MLPAVLTALALLASTTHARFVPRPEQTVMPRDDTYFQINSYSDTSCQNYISEWPQPSHARGADNAADLSGYITSPFVYGGDGGGIYAGSFIVVNMGTWAQTLDINGETVFDMSGCPGGGSREWRMWPS